MGLFRKSNSITDASSHPERASTDGSIALEILEGSGELVATVDLDGHISFANQSLREALKIPRTGPSSNGSRLPIVSTLVRKPMTEEILRHTLREGQWSGECELVSSEGNGIPVFLKTGILHAKNGQVCGVSCSSHLLLERQEDDKQLQLLNSLVQTSEEAIIGKTVHGIIYSWNPAAERIFGYSVKQILGNSDDLLLPCDRKAEGSRLTCNVLRGERVDDFETVRLRSDGSSVNVNMNISPTLDRCGEVVGSITIVRDISQSKQIEKQLKHAQRLESVGRLAGGLAHEFNNVLSVILGYSELALDFAKNDQQLCNYLEQIRRSTHRATSITRQILAFSQREAIEPVVVDLEASVAQIHQMTTKLIGDDIESELKGSSVPQRILADQWQMEQVILSLILRARDAMPRGGKLTLETKDILLTASPSPEITGFVAGEYCLLSVSDTGAAIAEEARKRIFEHHDSADDARGVVGFELAQIPNILKQSGGFIVVRSTSGRGTSFDVYFPKAEQAITKSSVKAEMGELPRGTETVLIVDDDDSLRHLTKLLLSSLGYSVLEASSGMQAMTVVEHSPQQIHLLLTDVIMPGMNGRELAAKCVSIRPATEVLLTSGYTGHLLNYYVGSKCANNLLSKPFSRSTLAYQVRKTLDEKTSHAAMAAEWDQVDSFTL